MVFFPESAVERMMKIQEAILRAMAKKITWSQAAEIIGISDRQMRRWYERYREFGYDGLFDRRWRRPSPKRVPVEMVEQVWDSTARSTPASTCSTSRKSCASSTASG